MKPDEKTIKVTEINLDQENPRFPPVNSQREAINAMLADQGEKLVKLALDIYQNGLNPSVKLILFKEGKQFVDGDGNRRLTALKILETPSLAEAFPKIRKGIDAILKRPGEVPTEVGCVIFQDRESARHWIAVNHGGEQEGRGQINWNPEQKDRFERKPSIGLEALDLLTHRGLITSDDKSQVNKTTLDRLLNYKDVKADLAITKKGGHFNFGDVDYLRKVVLNLRGKTVDAVYTKEKGKAFIRESIATTGSGSDAPGAKVSSNPTEPGNAGTGPGSRSRRIKKHSLPLFGGKLSLKTGHVNNLYRDVESLHDFYQNEKGRLSADFIVIIRMSLRILAETAAKDLKKDINDYLTENFELAKKSLDQNAKTTLSNQNVSKDSIIKLFHTGAHDYHNSKNEEQALALSIILGAMLNLTHGKQP
jgi:hypothetical protein